MAETDVTILRVDAGEAGNTLRALRERIKELKENLSGLDIKSREYDKTLRYLAEAEAALNSAMKGSMTSRAAVYRESVKLNAGTEQYSKALEDARKAQQAYNLTQEDTLRLARLTVQAQDAAEGSYNQLSKQYSALKIQLNGMSEEMRLNTEAGQKMEQEAMRIYQQMIKLQEATGKHTLSVGNYSKAFNGLNNVTAQVVRELPSLAISANTFFLAISNNIPILVDQINLLRQQNAEVIAQGGKGTGVLKAVLKSFLSWNTVLTLVITAVTLFGDDLIKLIGNLFKTKDAALDTAEAMDNMRKAMDFKTLGQQTADIEALAQRYRELGDNAAEKEEFIKKYREELDATGIAVNDVKDAENLLIDNTDAYIAALARRSMANAGMQKASEEYAKAIEVRGKKDEWYQTVLRSNAKYQKDYDEAIARGDENAARMAQSSLRTTQMELAKIALEFKKNEDVAASYLRAAQDMMDEADQILQDHDLDPLQDDTGGTGEKAKETVWRELEFIRQADDEMIALMDNDLQRALELNRVKYERQIEDLETMLATEKNITERGREEIYRIISYLVERQERDKVSIILEYNGKIEEANSELLDGLVQDATEFADREISEYERELKALEKTERQKAKIRKQEEKNTLKGIDSEEESAIAQAEKEMPTDSQFDSVRIKQEMALADRIYQIQQESDMKRLEQMKKFQQDAIDNGDVETWLDYKQQIADTEEEIEQRKNEHIAEQDEAAAERRKATTQDMLNTMQGLASGTSSILSSIADMYEEDAENSEEAAKKVKALRIASATIETISGAIGAFMQASSTIPPPAGQIVGAVQAAAVIATGLAQIQKIRNTEIDKDSDTGGSISASVDAPALTPQVNEVRNITSASEEDRLNRMASDQRVYILSSDIEASQRQRQVQIKETTF